MQRREFLASTSLAGAVAIAGCNSLFETESVRSVPDVVEDRPDAVYFPTHVEGMEMIGMTAAGDYTIGLMYSFPHRFWTVTGTTTEKVSIRDKDDIHLMASVWDDETGTVLPVGSGLSMTVEQDGEIVTEKPPWPMISQNMGFHYGDNFALDGEGTYDVTLDIGSMNVSKPGPFEGRFEESASGTVEFEYSVDERDGLRFETFENQQGERGAVDLMEMEMAPVSVAPEPDAMPGDHLTEATSGDAVFQVTAVRDPSFIDGSGTYLAVSPRTPFNRVPLPMMSLSGTVERGGEPRFDGALSKAVHPDIGYHYGALLDGIESDDAVTITVDTPPQVSRHEGYETAFVEMDPIEFTVS
ncbi:iron transporter [Halostella pelagica]|uniref:iron transporter n=1 Tax=Halostella pelagica TaxID=2583824 RepID=UPI0010812A7E|nr:iron transporter [Halostella pelagica]